jgi:hypothetical protein
MTEVRFRQMNMNREVGGLDFVVMCEMDYRNDQQR